MLCCTQAALLTVSDLLQLCMSWCFFLGWFYFSLVIFTNKQSWELSVKLLGTDVHFMVPFFLSWLYVSFPRVVLMCTSKCLSF